MPRKRGAGESGRSDAERPQEREVVRASVPDTAAAEAAVARLASLGQVGGPVTIRVEPVTDDPSTVEVEAGICLVAEVPALRAEAARSAMEPQGGAGVCGGEGGI